MVLTAMWCGIAFLGGCLLTLLLTAPFYKRAVRLATRDVMAATPLSMPEIRADRDHLRAQFAVAIRRLEVNLNELRTKSANQSAEFGRRQAEICGLKAELEKRGALIVALRARQQARYAATQRIVKLVLRLFVRIVKVLYLFNRTERQRRRALLAGQAAMLRATPARVIGQKAA